jgi:tetratricopeptide (TPR) repeat protein
MATVTPEIAFQLALGHRQAGRLAESEGLLRQIVGVQPGHSAAWHQLGLVVLTLGRPAEAIELLQRALALAPAEAAIHSDLGVAWYMSGNIDQSIACSREALRRQPNLPNTHRNLGDALFASGRNEEAIASYRQTIALAPNDAGGYNNLGNVFLRQSDLPEAAKWYERAVQLDPRLLVAQSNLGDVLTKLGRPEEGLACSQRVLAIDPNFPDGYLNMGVAYFRQARFAEAEACYRRAIALRSDFPDAHLNLGLLLLLHKRYEEGWREYEWHWRCPTHPSRRLDFATPPWDGSPVPGKTILAYADQGFGDTLQFIRYLPMLLAQSQAAHITVECQPALLPLLQQLAGPQVDFVSRDKSLKDAPPHDFQVSLFNLPLFLRCYEPFVPKTPYLQADETNRAGWRARLASSPAPRVGIAWAGNPKQGDDRFRSMKAHMVEPILRVPGITFLNLQIESTGPLPPVFSEIGVLDFREQIADFSDSAALFAELDLIITVDTGTCHLAGALGCPTWAILSFVADWRYGLADESCPWYPSIRQFRQPSRGDWASVVAQVAQELAKTPPAHSAV